MSAPSSAGARLEARGVVRAYGGVVAVDHVDLVAEPATVTAIVGPNGAGKTSLFHCLSGFDPPDDGQVLVGGRDVTRWRMDERARAGLATTFQHSSVFSSMTVLDNLRVAAENRRRRGLLRGLAGLPELGKARVGAQVDAVIDRLGLGEVRDVQAGALPIGTLRVVELARALCTDPSVLLLDEPAAGLDDDETVALRDHLRGLRDAGLTVIVIEHDLTVVRSVATVVYAMAGGRIVGSEVPVGTEPST